MVEIIKDGMLMKYTPTTYDHFNYLIILASAKRLDVEPLTFYKELNKSL
ncbi:MAG: hypothetical protein JZD40_07355 [Sulfolobus sp.]|nr:hypothetical protein [Sulfolobus sp.]MBP1358280.1 hypothetical protein [Sulfolobus sp.]